MATRAIASVHEEKWQGQILRQHEGLVIGVLGSSIRCFPGILVPTKVKILRFVNSFRNLYADCCVSFCCHFGGGAGLGIAHLGTQRQPGRQPCVESLQGHVAPFTHFVPPSKPRQWCLREELKHTDCRQTLSKVNLFLW